MKRRPASSKWPTSPLREQAVDRLLAAAAGVALEGHFVADEDPPDLALAAPPGRPRRRAAPWSRAAACRRCRGRRAGPRGWRRSRRRPRSSRRGCRRCRRSGPSRRSPARPAGPSRRARRPAASAARRRPSVSSGRARIRCTITGTAAEHVGAAVARPPAASPPGRSGAAAPSSRRSAGSSTKWKKPQEWKSGAAIIIVDRRCGRGSCRSARRAPAARRGWSAGRPSGCRWCPR